MNPYIIYHKIFQNSYSFVCTKRWKMAKLSVSMWKKSSPNLAFAKRLIARFWESCWKKETRAGINPYRTENNAIYHFVPDTVSLATGGRCAGCVLLFILSWPAEVLIGTGGATSMFISRKYRSGTEVKYNFFISIQPPIRRTKNSTTCILHGIKYKKQYNIYI